MTGFADDGVEDDMLMALADAELPHEQAASLRARIASDPALAERFALFVETRALVGADAAAAEAGDDPTVARIAAAIRSADDRAQAPSAPERRFRVVEGGASAAPPAAAATTTAQRPVMRWRFAAPALAASLALVVGGLLGYGAGRQGGGAAETGSVIALANAPAAAAAAARALDGSASGQPVAWTDAGSGLKGSVAVLSSHKVEGDRFCREYAISVDGRTERAVALGCRDAGGAWRTELVARAAGGDGYAKASGETIAETALTELGSVGALSEDEEAALIKRGWSNPAR